MYRPRRSGGPSKRMCYALDRNHDMHRPRLPPEITDSIVDLLRREREALKKCCLVSKSWVPCARKYLFRRIEFDCSDAVNAWKKTFPDSANSPAHHTCSLSFGCVEVIATADAEEGSWIRAFSNVVHLDVWSGTRNMLFHPANHFLLTRVYSHRVSTHFTLQFFDPYSLPVRSRGPGHRIMRDERQER